MSISFRTRQTLKRISSLVVIITAVTLVICLCLLVWLQRFVVYTDLGVILDFSAPHLGQGQLPQPRDDLPTVDIIYNTSSYQNGISGYHIDPKELMEDPDQVLERLRQLPEGTAVMFDVKGYPGNFYYSTQVGNKTSTSYNIEKMDTLIRWLANSDLYVIARMSALRDFNFVYNNNSCGLKTIAGGLYYDSGVYGRGCWMDPANETVQSYLTRVIKELKGLGFDEVVLENFCFPDTDDLDYPNDKAESLFQCAEKLVSACSGDNFTLSFATDDPQFSLPQGQCRLYLENISPADAATAWELAQVEDKRLDLVLVAPNDDDRYDLDCGVLRPLN